MNRRNLLITSVLLGFGLPDANATPETVTVDLVIVGSGAAGLSAAYWAAEGGLQNILVLEKEPVIGGSSTIAEGVFSVSDTPYQKAQNISDSNELFFDDMMRQGNFKNDPALVRLYITESKKVFDWFNQRGVHPSGVFLSAGMSAPRGHSFNSTALIQTLRLECEKKGIRILTSTQAVKLLTEQAVVSGVVAEVAGHHSLEIRSLHGVILATGGFTRNREMLCHFAPALKNAAVISGIGSTGDGISMALPFGSQLADTAFIKASYGFRLNPASIVDFTSIYYEGAVIVNQQGRRFVNESSSYKTLGEKALEQPEGKSYIIFDNRMRLTAMEHRPIDRVLWSGYDRGEPLDFVFWGNTIEEAAKKAGLSPTAVTDTIKRYNHAVDSDQPDEFGRQTLSAGYGHPLPLEEPPYFIMPSVSAIMGTYCGLRVNTRMQVIGQGGQPIPGLFAAGEVMGGVHGENYITGTGLGKALTFGKVAGESVAAIAGELLK